MSQDIGSKEGPPENLPKIGAPNLPGRCEHGVALLPRLAELLAELDDQDIECPTCEGCVFTQHCSNPIEIEEDDPGSCEICTAQAPASRRMRLSTLYTPRRKNNLKTADIRCIRHYTTGNYHVCPACAQKILEIEGPVPPVEDSDQQEYGFYALQDAAGIV
jgi:hypothetical protein